MGMIRYGILLCAIAFACAQDDSTDDTSNNNKTGCLSQMVGWCDNMRYPKQGVGMSMLSITYEDPNGYYRVFCASDSDGTNCTRNSQPWFACSSDNNTFTYKGAPPSSAGLDDEICPTADKAFNELFVQNLSYDNTTLQTELEKGMESFFAQIAAMQEQIEMIQRRLLPLFGDDPWGAFGRPENTTWNEIFRRPGGAPSNGTTTGTSNQIEKE